MQSRSLLVRVGLWPPFLPFLPSIHRGGQRWIDRCFVGELSQRDFTHSPLTRLDSFPNSRTFWPHSCSSVRRRQPKSRPVNKQECKLSRKRQKSFNVSRYGRRRKRQNLFFSSEFVLYHRVCCILSMGNPQLRQNVGIDRSKNDDESYETYHVLGWWTIIPPPT